MHTHEPTIRAALITMHDDRQAIVSMRPERDSFWPYRVYIEYPAYGRIEQDNVGARDLTDAIDTWRQWVNMYRRRPRAAA